MPIVSVDGKEVEFKPGEKIIDVAARANNYIPRYCYHEGLSIVAQCRMCLVEVEGQKKLLTSCSTPCADGMKISTKSERVKKAVSGVQEFLLANHPLDCPICDQAGECSLQENSYAHGEEDTRYSFFRRTYIDVDMGPSIKKNMNRCIHCTRCIRYCDEVGQIHEMIAEERGNSLEIITIDNKPLQTAYAGGLADVCPVGSLTTKDFRFKKRVWYLKDSPGVCDGCSKGCNITTSHEDGIIYRLQPRENQEINKWWMCDEGRYGFQHVHSPSRISTPAEVNADSLSALSWSDAFALAQKTIAASKKIAVLVCADATLEDAKLLQSSLSSAAFYSYSPSVNKSGEDEALDHLLRRKDKSPNMKGLEELGFKAFSEFKPKDYDSVILVSAGKVRPPYGIATLAKNTIAIGVFLKEELAGIKLVLPSLSTFEKSGTFVNHDGVEQSFSAAIPPLGQSRPLNKIMSALSGSSRKGA